MVPTTKEFLATLTGTHKVVAEEILSTLCFPEQIDRLGEVLAVVEGLIQYMLMTCPAGIERWKDWASTLPELREKAGALERESGVLPPTTRTKGNPWLRCSPPQIVLAFLWIGFDSGPPDEETAFRLNALKGLLLAAYAAKAFGKMKAGDAETLDRLSNMFPPHERPLLWLRLSVSLRGVLSQKLIPKADGTGRVAGVEVMIVTPTISKMLEEGKSEDIYAQIRQAGLETYWGMQTMNQCLIKYFKAGVITQDEALANSGNLTEMRQMLRR